MNPQGVSNTKSGRNSNFDLPVSWLKSELNFGMKRADGSLIPEDAWTLFLDEAVAPRFPGHTVATAQGSCLNRRGKRVTEPSRVLTIVHPDEFGARVWIAALKLAWELDQAQESVLVVTTPVEVLS